MDRLIVIGAGLAGCEATWQAINRGVEVDLYEMRPEQKTPAHNTGFFAELVCSNSLGANHLHNAGGILKEEMRHLNSLIIKTADKHRVPAGRALAVDRNEFAREITKKLKEHPGVHYHNEEVTDIPEDRVVIIATGPLTSDKLTKEIKKLTGEEYLYFFDAAAPIITADSIDYNKVFRASRYEDGKGDYLNCPMSREEYEEFWNALVSAERHQPHNFEKDMYFEGCLPIEVLAERGKKTLLFGPLKPVGLVDPNTQEKPYAVVQLRQDNAEGTLYNLVGFQTRLKWGEQKRIINMIPGLENAEIVRYGVMHRNTYLNSPKLLNSCYQLRHKENIFFAGQITGVEGYVESASSGLIAGLNAARLLQGKELLRFPRTTAHGALSSYISNPAKDKLQPMNINFGLFPPLDIKIRNKRERKEKKGTRALEDLKGFMLTYGLH
ncbi:methylenetetrahydrofolate--tRNA-(uracil(54)-C(5))-methyltransferase (FADH(2)-oxidizing) TrmFO [Halothermothrix orenii]|uniref:Methylenetetrahydrofolate--tRNA-(uracil-5-)-methyltransferase TrmFO n=1 Tax=Halothermothrix orenii (strain H 168 / OCM 544 / DSM 9562) TaxID=373903 RepID=B8CW43_HALOH|nr:methylenetetrahydrofolate--tRNA-(uracil(54)-C(5))-methyltransferase (FADH(2)-oxidizing) TrmFO [Halothermothrix orenii]ACL69512.1 gid protein [Halothermothrix orenii H 168]